MQAKRGRWISRSNKGALGNFFAVLFPGSRAFKKALNLGYSRRGYRLVVSPVSANCFTARQVDCFETTGVLDLGVRAF